jgi:hypothetical protein
MKNKIEDKNVSIITNDLGIYVIKVESEGATESCWLDSDEIGRLKKLINSLDLSNSLSN